jgi:hypothetical protein
MAEFREAAARSALGTPPPLTVVHPGEGRAATLSSIGVVFKLWGEDAGGAVAIVEHPFPVGALVSPHLYTREDEYSIVLEGEIGFRSGDGTVSPQAPDTALGCLAQLTNVSSLWRIRHHAPFGMRNCHGKSEPTKL